MAWIYHFYKRALLLIPCVFVYDWLDENGFVEMRGAVVHI